MSFQTGNGLTYVSKILKLLFFSLWNVDDNVCDFIYRLQVVITNTISVLNVFKTPQLKFKQTNMKNRSLNTKYVLLAIFFNNFIRNGFLLNEELNENSFLN